MIKHDLPIGTIISQHRLAKQLSQKELAELAHVREKYLSDIECGRRHPRINMLAGIASTLEIPIDELTRADGNKA